MEIILGNFIGWILGMLLVNAYFNYSDNRSKRHYRFVWRKKKNYNKFRK